MSTVTILTADGRELFFPQEIDEEGRTWTWKAHALADGSLLLSLGSIQIRRFGVNRIIKEEVRVPAGSWIAQRWETGSHSKRDRFTNQIIM